MPKFSSDPTPRCRQLNRRRFGFIFIEFRQCPSLLQQSLTLVFFVEILRAAPPGKRQCPRPSSASLDTLCFLHNSSRRDAGKWPFLEPPLDTCVFSHNPTRRAPISGPLQSHQWTLVFLRIILRAALLISGPLQSHHWTLVFFRIILRAAPPISGPLQSHHWTLVFFRHDLKDTSRLPPAVRVPAVDDGAQCPDRR